jgi:hypothetical protein
MKRRLRLMTTRSSRVRIGRGLEPQLVHAILTAFVSGRKVFEGHDEGWLVPGGALPGSFRAVQVEATSGDAVTFGV